MSVDMIGDEEAPQVRGAKVVRTERLLMEELSDEVCIMTTPTVLKQVFVHPIWRFKCPAPTMKGRIIRSGRGSLSRMPY